MRGAELRRRRRAKGLSIYGVAEGIGVTAATVSRWESGERGIHPAFERLLKLYFGGSLGETFKKPKTKGGKADGRRQV